MAFTQKELKSGKWTLDLEGFKDRSTHLGPRNVHHQASNGSSILRDGQQHLWQERLGLSPEGIGSGRRKVVGDQLAPLIVQGRNSVEFPAVVMEGSWQLQIRLATAEVRKVLEAFLMFVIPTFLSQVTGKRAGRWEVTTLPCTAGEGPQVWKIEQWLC